MAENGVIPWESLEQRSSRLFHLGAVVIVGALVLVGYDVINGTEVRLPYGQVFVGTSWTAVLLGMLGLYPRLADERPWLARVGGLFAGIGVLGYVLMTVAFGAAVAGVPESTLASYTPVFLLPVGAGTLFAFPLFAVAGLLTGAYSRTVSLLLASLTVIFVANYLTGPSAESIFVVVVALIVVFGTIGYLLRTDGVSTEQTQSSTEMSV